MVFTMFLIMFTYLLCIVLFVMCVCFVCLYASVKDKFPFYVSFMHIKEINLIKSNLILCFSPKNHFHVEEALD